MNVSKKKWLSLLYALPALLALALFLYAPARYAACVREGVSLWAVSVLPSVFPFLFLTAILSDMRVFRAFSRRISPFFERVFNISGTGGGILLLSVLSGYPVGARTVADCSARGALAKEELFRLSCLCSTTGPVFLAGVVGGAMFSDPRLGWLMLLCHLCAVLGVGLVLRIRTPRIRVQTPPPAAQNGKGIFDVVYGAIVSVLCVGGSIALFACFSQMSVDLLHLNPNGLPAALVRGLMEMTTGCSLLSAEVTPLSLSLCCFFVTFGGMCVLMQQLTYLAPLGVNSLKFILVKSIQGVLAAALCYLLALFLL